MTVRPTVGYVGHLPDSDRYIVSVCPECAELVVGEVPIRYTVRPLRCFGCDEVIRA